jgi:putative acetyltransferase
MLFTSNHLVYRKISPLREDVRDLIKKLDDYQISLYGKGACNLESADSLMNNNAYMIGAFMDEHIVGMGAVKLMKEYAEVKRMFVDERFRGLSIAANILSALEKFAMQNKITTVCLETGNLHHAAIAFYKKSGYTEVESFGSYKANGVSVYFAKQLSGSPFNHMYTYRVD